MTSEASTELRGIDLSSSARPKVVALGALAAGVGNLVLLFVPWMGTSVDPANVDSAGIVSWGAWPADRTAFDLSVPIAVLIAFGCIAAAAIAATRLGGIRNSNARSSRLLIAIGGTNLALSLLLVYFVADNPLSVDVRSLGRADAVSWGPLTAFWLAICCSSLIAAFGVLATVRSKSGD